jgi:hypothetical protein
MPRKHPNKRRRPGRRPERRVCGQRAAMPAELVEIGLPVFSNGSYPPGPMRLDKQEPEALASARFGPHEVAAEDIVARRRRRGVVRHRRARRGGAGDRAPDLADRA